MTREIIKRNLDVRAAAKSAGVFLYEIAEKLAMSEPTFIRYLRKDLSDGMKVKVFSAIKEIKREHESEQQNISAAEEEATFSTAEKN